MSINPIAFSFGPINIYWYAISYIVSILFGEWYVKKLLKYRETNISNNDIANFVNYFVIGIIIGGRLGHVLFFDPEYYIQKPYEALYLWHGGMSFHGGALGALAAMYYFAYRHKKDFWLLADLITCAAPIGLCFGRVSNFINQELYGIPTDSIFGVVFTRIDPLPRHPVQLYEAATEGVALFFILRFLYISGILTRRLAGVFAILYSLFRFLIEYLKVPDTIFNTNLLSALGLSVGQLMSCIFVIIGILIVTLVREK